MVGDETRCPALASLAEFNSKICMQACAVGIAKLSCLLLRDVKLTIELESPEGFLLPFQSLNRSMRTLHLKGSTADDAAWQQKCRDHMLVQPSEDDMSTAVQTTALR